jgi:hypothetical protein
LVEKPEGKWPLGRPRSRWEDNIVIDLREIWRSGMDSIDLAQNRGLWRAVVSTVMHLLVPQNVGKFLRSWGTGGFSKGLRSMELVVTLTLRVEILYCSKWFLNLTYLKVKSAFQLSAFILTQIHEFIVITGSVHLAVSVEPCVYGKIHIQL